MYITVGTFLKTKFLVERFRTPVLNIYHLSMLSSNCVTLFLLGMKYSMEILASIYKMSQHKTLVNTIRSGRLGVKFLSKSFPSC